MSASFLSALKSTSVVPKTNALKVLLRNLAPATISTLGNGVRVACEPVPSVQTSTIGIFVQGGSRFEEPYYAGTAALFQKCGFISTKNQTSDEIRSAIDELGGQLRADVGKEFSYVTVTVSKENIHKSVQILSDMVCNASFADADISLARKAIEEERNNGPVIQSHHALDGLYTVAFGNTHNDPGLGTSIFGSSDSLARIGKEQLNAFRLKCLRGRRIVVVGMGNIDHRELEMATQQCMGDVSPSGDEALAPFTSQFNGGETRLKNCKESVATAIWAVEGPHASSPDTVPLLLACALKRSLQAPLLQSVSCNSLTDHTFSRFGKNQNVALTTSPLLHTFYDTGLCGVRIDGLATESEESASRAVAAAMQQNLAEWYSLATSNVSDMDLEHAKAHVKTQLLLKMDNGVYSPVWLGKDVLQIGRRIPYTEMFERIDAVSQGDLQKVVKHYFLGKPIAVSYEGEGSSFPSYSTVKRWNKKFWF